jgi:hypothetical protein
LTQASKTDVYRHSTRSPGANPARRAFGSSNQLQDGIADEYPPFEARAVTTAAQNLRCLPLAAAATGAFSPSAPASMAGRAANAEHADDRGALFPLGCADSVRIVK